MTADPSESTHPYNSDFLRLLRKSGWKQVEAALQLGISQGAVSMYVSGKARPGVPVLQLFRMLLGDDVPLPQVSDGTGSGDGELREDTVPYSIAEHALIREMRSITDRGKRDQVIRMIRDLVRLTRGDKEGG